MNVEIYMSLMKVYGWDNRRQDSLRRKSVYVWRWRDYKKVITSIFFVECDIVTFVINLSL